MGTAQSRYMPLPGLFVGVPGLHLPARCAHVEVSTTSDVAHFALLASFRTDVRVLFPVLKNFSWRVKEEKSGVLGSFDQLLLQQEFIFLRILKAQDPSRRRQKWPVDYTLLFHGPILRMSLLGFKGIPAKSGKTARFNH